MAMRNLASRWGVVRSRGRVAGVRHIQGGGESGGEAASASASAAAEPEMAQQDKAYSSSSPQHHHHSKEERPHDKPEPSPRVVRQNAKLVKDSMNTKNI